MSQKLQSRKIPRLKHHDYTHNGIYFVTACTHEREPILGKVTFDTDGNRNNTADIANNNMTSLTGQTTNPNPFITPAVVELTPIGEFVSQNIANIPNKHQNVEIDKYVVMPNHIHLLILLRQEQYTQNHSMQSEHRNLRDASLSEIVHWLKIVTSRKYGEILWQRSYYDHIIRSEHDYKNIWQYIDENPQRWMFDKYYKA